jgi:hypothetical protein
MGEITITFMGICTHFLDVETPTGLVHRVVLVNASGNNIVAGLLIPPHFATMQIVPPQGPVPASLAGVQVSFNVTGELLLDSTYSIVPTLQTLMANIVALGPASSLLLDESPWPAVAAYFDIPAGTFSGQNVTGAAQVTATIPTPEGSDVVEMTITPFPGSDATPQTVKLVSGTSITVSNVGTPETEEGPDTGRHFLLHYLLAENFPPAPQVPPSIPGIAATVGAGCSDSNYP